MSRLQIFSLDFTALFCCHVVQLDPIIFFITRYPIPNYRLHRSLAGSGVTQGHQNWYHSIACLWFPISIL